MTKQRMLKKKHWFYELNVSCATTYTFRSDRWAKLQVNLNAKWETDTNKEKGVSINKKTRLKSVHRSLLSIPLKVEMAK